MKRKLAVLTMGMLCAQWVCAQELPFSQARFDAALKAHAPVIVDFSADWCPTCRIQKPLVASLAASPKYSKVTVLIANYDLEKDLERRLNIGAQSTLVVFKGGHEVGRAAGVISLAGLDQLFGRAL